MKWKRMALFGATLALMRTAVVSAGELKVLCTTFPIYQITRNVMQAREEADVQLLLPAALGCPHDHALTPQDMQKLVGAKVLVVNGLGLEEFLGAPVTRVNADIVVVDSSSGSKALLRYQDDRHDHDAKTKHTGINPHLFASPRMAAQLAIAIASGLGKADPAGAVLYKQNAETYAARMNRLADEFVARGKMLKNNRIVTQHGVFDYLARDMGLEVVAVVQAHAGQEPSAADMLKIVKDVREKKAGAIFTEPQYPGKVGQTIARETRIPAATLDPVATGPEAAPLDYYETVMRKNMETLRATLGVNK
jgi:zinc transport system substrate-binding protein